MKVVLVLGSDTLGRGDNELGQTLLVNFLRAVAFRDDGPQTVVCYNSGVRLAEIGSQAAPMLEAISRKGAEVLLCGTCVDYFQNRDRLAMGEVSDMPTIVDRLVVADKVLYT